MSGRLRAHCWSRVRGRPGGGAELECLGLILGHPFWEKFGYKSGRQMCGPCPPSLGSKHTAVSQETAQTSRPPTVIYTRTPSPSGPGLGLSVHSSAEQPELRTQPCQDWRPLQQACSGLGAHYLPMACPLEALGPTIRNVLMEARAWAAGRSLRLEPWSRCHLLHDCGSWHPCVQ